MLDVIVGMVRESFQLYVVGFCTKQAFQHGDNFLEVWSRGRLGLPAIVHYVVKFSAAMLWFLQPVTFADLEYKDFRLENIHHT